MNKAGLAVYDVHSCLVWCMIFFMHIRHCHKLERDFTPPCYLPLGNSNSFHQPQLISAHAERHSRAGRAVMTLFHSVMLATASGWC